MPAFRHRHQPDHPAVAALRNQPRDATLTIDAGFQYRVSDIVAAYAKKSGTRAAAVVVDPDSGDLLAFSTVYADTGVNLEANETVCEFLRQKVRSTALVRVSRTARNQRRQPMR